MIRFLCCDVYICYFIRRLLWYRYRFRSTEERVNPSLNDSRTIIISGIYGGSFNADSVQGCANHTTV